MGGKIFTIIIFIVVLSGIVFFFRSGAPGGISSFVENLSFAPGTSTVRATPPREPRPAATPSQPPKETTVASEEIKPAIDPRLIPEGFTAEDLSPYFRQIRLAVSRTRITLRGSFAGGGTLNISGWTLQGRRSSRAVPQAVNVYEPSGLAPETDIFLRNGDYLYIYYGQSAIGVNLRLNKCVGYLENTNKFSPSLPKSCPNPVNDFDMNRVTGVCQNYIRTLTSCRLPSLNPPIPDTDYVCRDYLNQIHLTGCYARHRSDTDFLSRERRAWFGSTFLDPIHDKVLLLDGEGKLVDMDEY